MGKHTFKKVERLSRQTHIQELFDKGSSFHLPPYKVIALPHPEAGYPLHQVFFSVPKRNFKKAVDRNTLKRRMREAYRLQKELLAGTQILLIAYIYLQKEMIPSAIIHEKMREALTKLKLKYDAQK